jgi:hypothetical protein
MARRAAIACVALALCACGSPAVAPQTPLNPSLALRAPVRAMHRERGPSWIQPGAQSHNLLYISDGGGESLDIYLLPGVTKTGEITDLEGPEGVCTDKTGAVWVVTWKDSKIIKYGHAGKKKLATLEASAGQRLLDCSVDPTTGNLAVTDLGGAAGAGSLFVFAGATGNPKQFVNSQLLEVFFCAYDASGNLFLDGLDKTYTFQLAELPAGSSNLKILSVNQTIVSPGGMRWDGQYLAVGDQAYQDGHDSAIYRLTVTSSGATVAGTTVLNKSCDVLGFALEAAKVVTADACENNVRFYKYPAGGNSNLLLKGFQYPVSAVVSFASQ